MYGALLALEAQELLANRTPTTALEALAVRHELEVTAECMFYGVEYNFDVRRRLEVSFPLGLRLSRTTTKMGRPCWAVYVRLSSGVAPPRDWGYHH